VGKTDTFAENIIKMGAKENKIIADISLNNSPQRTHSIIILNKNN